MGVLAFLAGVVFVATLLLLLATFKNLETQEGVAKAQERAQNDTYSEPLV